jgi:putative hydrolase of HD superfamily
MFALILAEYAPEPVNALKVIKMALVHDLVEIDAGDTFLYDVAGNADKAEREQKAADRIFAILPEDQGAELRALWDEFEAKETPEAKFAGAIDRFHPFLHNCNTRGRAWREHDIAADRVLESNSHIAVGAPELWERVKALVDEMIAEGYIDPGEVRAGG